MIQVKINRLALLAWLDVPEGDRYASMENSLGEIIEYFSVLDPIDTSSVTHITSPGSLLLPLRYDEVHDDLATREELLACSPQRVAADQIMLDSIMQTDEK